MANYVYHLETNLVATPSDPFCQCAKTSTCPYLYMDISAMMMDVISGGTLGIKFAVT